MTVDQQLGLDSAVDLAPHFGEHIRMHGPMTDKTARIRFDYAQRDHLSPTLTM